MKKLPAQFIEPNKLDPFQKVLVESLVDCLEVDDSCHATWRQLCLRTSKQSATLLSYIRKLRKYNYIFNKILISDYFL